MKKQIATFCCLMVIHSSVVIAAETGNAAQPPSVTVTARRSNTGPLRRASLDTTPWLRADARQDPQQNQTSAAAPDTRSWMERHPVWTGTMVGFAAGFVITYAATGDDGKEFIDFSGMRGQSSLVFGGVSAGIGALMGWGIGRSKHDARKLVN